MGAFSHILENTFYLSKLSIKHTEGIEKDSLDQLISFLCGLLRGNEAPELTELEFGGLGGTTAQGEDVLDAIYETAARFKKLDISDNPTWALGDRYAPLLREFLLEQANLESINVSYNYKEEQADEEQDD